MDKQLLEYIKKELGKGFPENKIRQALQKAGHPSDNIEEHFRMLKEKEGELEKTLKTEEKIQEELAEYARKQLDSGLTEEEIKEKLITAGHTEEKAERHIRHAQKQLRGINKELASETRQVEKAKKAVEKDIDKELLEYIGTQKKAGYTEQQIIESLKAEGHEREHVQRHIAEASRKKGLQSQEEKNIPDTRQTSGKNCILPQAGQVEENISAGKETQTKDSSQKTQIAHKIHTFFSETRHAIWHKEYVLALLILCALILAIHYVVVPSYNYMNAIAEGDLAFEAQNYTTAEEHYTLAYSIRQTPKATLQLARTYLKKQDYEQALQKYEEYSILEPESHIGTGGQGIALMSMQQYDRAIQRLEESIKIQQSEAANRWLGKAYLAKNMTKEAEQYFLKSLEINRTGQVLLETGRFYESQQRYADAEQYLAEAVQLNPEITQAQCSISGVLMRLKEFNRSVQHAKQCRDMDSNQNSQYTLAKALYLAKDYNRAIQEYLTFMEIPGVNTTENYNQSIADLGQAYYHTQNYTEAVKWLEITSVGSKSMIARAFQSMGNYSAAILYYLSSDNEEYVGLGVSYTSLQDYPKAQNYFFAEIKRDPDSIEGYSGLGITFYRQSNYSESEKYFLKALSIDSNFYVNRGLTMVYYAMNKTDLAKKYYTLANMFPHQPNQEFEQVGEDLSISLLN